MSTLRMGPLWTSPQSIVPLVSIYPRSLAGKRFGKLKAGDIVLRGIGKDAHDVAIKSLDFSDVTKKANVYNFHVDTFMNYYVDGILVHNYCMGPGGPGN